MAYGLDFPFGSAACIIGFGSIAKRFNCNKYSSLKIKPEEEKIHKHTQNIGRAYIESYRVHIE